MTPIVVLQADARRHPGSVRAPLSVGLVRWRGSGDHVAFVAKACLSYGEGGAEVAARLGTPSPVGPGAPSELAPEMSSEPSDFVFAKAQCDVLLVGHAHAESPSETIRCELRAGEVSWRFVARSRAKRAAVPLVRPFVVDEREQAIDLGPHPIAREQEGDRLAAFDLDRLQSAAPPFRIAPPDPGVRLELVGLSPRGPRRVVQLPGLAPRLFVERTMGELEEIAMRLDTLTLDTDHETVTLSWRGTWPSPDPAVDRVVASLERAAAPREPSEILADLPRGEVAFAIEEAWSRRPDPDELELARHETLLHVAKPTLALDEYARLVARLAEARRPREEELAAFGLDERSFLIEDRAYGEAMAGGIDRGDATLATEYGEAFARAQRELAGPQEPRPYEEYAAVKSRLDAGERPDDVLAESGISLGEWLRLERVYAARGPDENGSAEPA